MVASKEGEVLTWMPWWHCVIVRCFPLGECFAVPCWNASFSSYKSCSRLSCSKSLKSLQIVVSPVNTNLHRSCTEAAQSTQVGQHLHRNCTDLTQVGLRCTEAAQIPHKLVSLYTPFHTSWSAIWYGYMVQNTGQSSIVSDNFSQSRITISKSIVDRNVFSLSADSAHNPRKCLK